MWSSPVLAIENYWPMNRRKVRVPLAVLGARDENVADPFGPVGVPVHIPADYLSVFLDGSEGEYKEVGFKTEDEDNKGNRYGNRDQSAFACTVHNAVDTPPRIIVQHGWREQAF